MKYTHFARLILSILFSINIMGCSDSGIEPEKQSSFEGVWIASLLDTAHVVITLHQKDGHLSGYASYWFVFDYHEYSCAYARLNNISVSDNIISFTIESDTAIEFSAEHHKNILVSTTFIYKLTFYRTLRS